MKSKKIIILLASMISIMALPRLSRAGEWRSGTVSTASGARNYKLWVPSGLEKRKPVPLVMMLHGCTQKPEDLATVSGMNEVADRNNFLVVYPEQTAEANPLRCWNWFDPRHQARDSGEPALLAAAIKQVQASNSVDPNRIFVAGISAGAAMAVVMGVTYPDLFNGIGVCAGLEFKAATSVETGLAAMKQGGPDPKQQGLIAFQAIAENLRGKSKRRMPVIIFQGDVDPYVNPLNAEQVIAQWAKTNDYLDDGKDNDSVKHQPAGTTEGSVPGGHQFTKSIYNDRDGRLLMEKWIVKGLGHAWSGSPIAGPFADPKGPNASAKMWRFFADTTSRAPKPRAGKSKGMV
jgi:poly(hydroxyalkanoate) depolymerase family esterase